MSILRPYQVQAVKDIIDKQRIILADDRGLGKTAEAIVARTAMQKRTGDSVRTLIACPLAVVQHWEGEIYKWAREREQTRVVKIQTQSYEADVQKAREADFVILPYSTLSYFGEGSKIGRLEEIPFVYGIIDEGHNVKNPDSLRSNATRQLFQSTPYLAILTGTPIPNSIVDIYTLLNLVDKKRFPLNGENKGAILRNFFSLFRQDPEFVQRFFNEFKLRRKVEDYLEESEGARFPVIDARNLEIELRGEHKDAYMQVYENDSIPPTCKLIQLIKASIDPNLVKDGLLTPELERRKGKIISNVYETLDEIVAEATSRGKVLIFTDLKTGVTQQIRRRYEQHGALLIEGDVPSITPETGYSQREEIRRRFQTDPNSRVLIVTDVMDEGVDLTAATDVIHLTLPYTPAGIDQRNRRAQRIGEVKKDKVNVYYVIPKVGIIPTIVEGIMRLLEDKRKIIDFLLKDPTSLTSRELEEIKNGHSEKSVHLASILCSPNQTINNHLGSLKAQGHERIHSSYSNSPETARNFSRIYASHWEGNYGGNTATLVARVIKLLEEKEGLVRKLDIASGPFSLSRRLQEPVVNVDINPFMLQTGRIFEQEGTIPRGNKAMQASFHQLPLTSRYFDLAVCSLALHMSSIKLRKKEKTTERELALREINRVLREDGKGIIALPHSVISLEGIGTFYEGLERLGFEVLPFSGFYRGPKKSRFKVFLAGVRKKCEPQEEPLDSSLLVWRMDEQLLQGRRKSSRKRKHGIPQPRTIEKEFVKDFYNCETGKRLEEVVK